MKKPSQKSGQALIVLDMVSEFRFEGWQAILAAARRIAPRIARLTQRARRAGLPVIYVNDMAADWDSDRRGLIRRAGAPGARGAEVLSWIAPGGRDHFVFKPKHSGFYGTALAELLYETQPSELILTGMTSHQCILFTAMDAYVRNYRLVVPRDCIGAPTAAQTRNALFILEQTVMARTPRAASLRFSRGAAR